MRYVVQALVAVLGYLRGTVREGRPVGGMVWEAQDAQVTDVGDPCGCFGFNDECQRGCSL
jgi:hypothetical protein